MIKKYSVKLLFLTALLICVSFAVFTVSGAGAGMTASADTSDDNYNVSVDDNYSFSSVDMQVEVRKDKTYAITETLEVYFRYGNVNTGIIRDIQRITETTRIIDGSTVKGGNFLTELTDVKVTLDGGEAKVTRELYDQGNFHSVKMQKPSGYFEGDSTHTFVLSYVYDMSDDKVEGYDDFIFDVLGYAMNEVDVLTATITFPEGTDLSRTSYRTGLRNNWRPQRGEIAEINGNVITLKVLNLEKGKGFTVQTILPDGYFDVSRTFFWFYIPFAALAVAGIALCVWLVIKNTDRKPVETVEFYPPEGMSVMRFAAIWHNGAKNKDIAAVILKWADDDIVRIEPDGRRDMIITSLIPLESAKSNNKTGGKYFENADERNYFNKLFSGIGGDNYIFSTLFYRKKASKEDKEELSLLVNRMKARADKKPAPVKVNTDKAKIALPMISLLPSVAVLVYFAIITEAWFTVLFALFWAAGTFVGTEFNKSKMPLLVIFPISFYGLTYGAFFLGIALPIYDYAYMMYIAPVWWAVCTFILPHFFVKRTPEVMSDYGKMRGFRNFLLKAELNRIQLLFDENPEYFSEILPYCMIMNISDKVRKRFASLEIKVPEILDSGVTTFTFVYCVSRCSRAPFSSTVSSFMGSFRGGGGGGGHGGSHGGGGGGGGSRGC